jgi:hypothetical protein
LPETADDAVLTTAALVPEADNVPMLTTAVPDMPIGSPSGAEAEAQKRMHRVLAGANATAQLGTLTFSELSAVADDAQRAAETLRWVLARQRQLVLYGAGVREGGGSTADPTDVVAGQSASVAAARTGA